MSVIRIPFTDLITMIESTVESWPDGSQVKLKEHRGLFDIPKIAGQLASDLLDQAFRTRTVDPAVNLLKECGYPVESLSSDQRDYLLEQFDDQYMSITLAFSPIIKTLEPMLKDAAYQTMVMDEDLILTVFGNRWKINYQSLLKSFAEYKKDHARPKVPQQVSEVTDLAPVEQYINNTIGQLLADCQDPAVKEEVKRLISQCISQQ